MIGGIEEHPPRIAWLRIGLAGAQGENLCLARVEIWNVEVKVGLLRVFGAWPLRRPIIVDSLEGNGGVGATHELDPVTTVFTNRPSGYGAVESGKS